VPVNIALGPSATFFQAGERLQLLIADWSLWQVNPLTGQFPAADRKAPTTAAPCTSARSARPVCSYPSSPDVSPGAADWGKRIACPPGIRPRAYSPLWRRDLGPQ